MYLIRTNSLPNGSPVLQLTKNEVRHCYAPEGNPGPSAPAYALAISSRYQTAAGIPLTSMWKCVTFMTKQTSLSNLSVRTGLGKSRTEKFGLRFLSGSPPLC